MKDKPKVHLCTRVRYDPRRWKTACGLKLDPAARKETVLTDDKTLVTCPTCKKESR